MMRPYSRGERCLPPRRRSGLWFCCVCLAAAAAVCGCGQEDAAGPRPAGASAQSEPVPPSPAFDADDAPADDAPIAEQANDAVPQTVGRLVGLLRQRLALMPDVARWKRASDRPVSDPERERQLLAVMVERGTEEGLDPSRVADFVSAQFAASRQWQQELFDQWEQSEPDADTPVPDLQQELRPEITRLSGEMLETLAEIDALAVEQPEAVRQAMLNQAEQSSPSDAGGRVPPPTAWEHVRRSLRQWAESMPQQSRSVPAAR